jgi:hypothetical protein
MAHPEQWGESPDEARERWHAEARQRDEAYLALGPVDDTETHDSPWLDGPPVEVAWCHCVQSGYPGPHRLSGGCQVEVAS